MKILVQLIIEWTITELAIRSVIAWQITRLSQLFGIAISGESG